MHTLNCQFTRFVRKSLLQKEMKFCNLCDENADIDLWLSFGVLVNTKLDENCEIDILSN